MEEASGRRHLGGGIMEEASYRRHHGGGIKEKESWTRYLIISHHRWSSVIIVDDMYASLISSTHH